MTTLPPATTLSVSDEKAAHLARYLVLAVQEAIEQSTPGHEAIDATIGVLHGLTTSGGTWLHVTDLAVLATWVQCVEPPDQAGDTPEQKEASQE